MSASGPKLPLSVCVITKDEAANIRACLTAVSAADDIVVVDSGSIDSTVAIAIECGARVVHQEFLGHVKQKQRAVELARHDWVFCVDADEVANPELMAALAREMALPEAKRAAGYEVARHSIYAGKPIDHGGWWPEWRLRLFDRRRGAWGGKDPHDHVYVEGPVRRLSGELTHYNFRDLAHHVRKIDAYAAIVARRDVEAGRDFALHKLVLRPPLRFLKMYVWRQGFRDGLRGFILAWMGAFSVFLKYAKAWERQHGPREPKSR